MWFRTGVWIPPIVTAIGILFQTDLNSLWFPWCTELCLVNERQEVRIQSTVHINCNIRVTLHLSEYVAGNGEQKLDNAWNNRFADFILYLVNKELLTGLVCLCPSFWHSVSVPFFALLNPLGQELYSVFVQLSSTGILTLSWGCDEYYANANNIKSIKMSVPHKIRPG